MSKLILPGLPSEPDPKAGIALPLMRGFSCPVAAPFMGGDGAPNEGVGVGWSNVTGHGVRFFLSVIAEGGFVLVAQLDYARYKRLCENLASAGQQALLHADLETAAEDDPLKALAVAHEALTDLVTRCDGKEGVRPDGSNIDTLRAHMAIETVAKALRIDEKDEAK